jgi:hypothetical protein
MEFLKYRNGFRVTLLDIADDHVTADQLIKSKHSLRLETVTVAPLLPKNRLFLSITWMASGSLAMGDMPQSSALLA